MTTTAKSRRTRARETAMSKGEDATRRWFPDEGGLDALIDGVLERIEELRAGQAPPRPTLFADIDESELSVARRSPKVRQDIRKLVSQAFLSMFNGMPEDHVIINSDANDEFTTRCRLFGAMASEYTLNRTLLNVRKSGWHAGIERAPVAPLPRPKADRIGYAAEMAAKIVQLQIVECGFDSPSIDRILCDPKLRAVFDGATQSLAPGFSAYEYRLAVLAYRKAGRASTHRLGSTPAPDWELSAPLLRVDPDDVPDQPGIYSIIAGAKSLFVSSTLDLRSRILAHFAVAEGRSLVPTDLFDPPRKKLEVRWFATPEEWRPRRAEAVAWRMKGESKALFNLFANVG